MNNVSYLRHFESARIVHFEALVARAREIDPTFPADDFLKGEGVGPILAATSCRYRMPVVHPDTLTTTSSIDLGETGSPVGRFVMKYTMHSEAQNGAVVATGEGGIVVYDYANNAKAALHPALEKAVREVG